MMLSRFYIYLLKPFFDFILSFIGLLLLSPIIIVVIVLLVIVNKGTPFYRQSRPGKDEKVFKVIKFKTMTDEKDKEGNLLSDKDRLTKVGKFIRSTSIDEIPQLLNVIKGDMSLIGPRPLLVRYLPLYNDFQHRRHEIRPGITGWAQVNGRNAISWQKKLEFDVWYVDNISLCLDIKILIRTIKKVFLRSDINKEGVATTISFNGKN